MARPKKMKFRPNANPTGVNNAGVPVDSNGIEYTELPERIRVAMEEILRRKGRLSPQQTDVQESST